MFEKEKHKEAWKRWIEGASLTDDKPKQTAVPRHGPESRHGGERQGGQTLGKTQLGDPSALDSHPVQYLRRHPVAAASPWQPHTPGIQYQSSPSSGSTGVWATAPNGHYESQLSITAK